VLSKIQQEKQKNYLFKTEVHLHLRKK